MYLQHIVTFESLKMLWYSILITTQKGESEPIDLPFLLSQSPIFRACNLTPDLKMRYGSDIHIISEKLRYLCFSQYVCTFMIFGLWEEVLNCENFSKVNFKNADIEYGRIFVN